MATAPQQTGLPLLYNQLTPLSSKEHGDWKGIPSEVAPYLVNQHAVPVTVDEFFNVQRFYPIVFSASEQSVPLALMGLNEGVNTFVDEGGKLLGEVYVPAYIRRYPFMLASLNPGSDEVTLCFDPTSGLVGPEGEGAPLFENDKPSESVQAVLSFCEQFEQAAQRTGLFVKEIEEAKLLIDGEVTVQPEGSDKPFIYRGFRMVDENKLRDLRGDALRKLSRNGALPLLYAHLMSLQLMREIFGRQVAQGKMPVIEPQLV